MGGLGEERVTVRLRFRSLIRNYRIEYFTESVLASSMTMDPKPTSLERTGWIKGPWPHEDVVYGVFRVNHILCRFEAIEKCKNA